MIYLLDTDHLSELQHQQSSGRARLANRLANVADDAVAVCIVSAEEHMRGWLAKIHRQPHPRKQIQAYAQLHSLFAFYSRWQVLGHGLTLLTANGSDFEQVPGLSMENWLA